MAALRSDISDAQECSASAFTRDSATHARAVMALEDKLAKHIAASEIVEKQLTDLNIHHVKDIEALNATNAQSICDRE
eukprot:11447625-Heterocapsa_arctica.AAC.1